MHHIFYVEVGEWGSVTTLATSEDHHDQSVCQDNARSGITSRVDWCGVPCHAESACLIAFGRSRRMTDSNVVSNDLEFLIPVAVLRIRISPMLMCVPDNL